MTPLTLDEKTTRPDIAVISMSSSLLDFESSRSLEEMIFDTTTAALDSVALKAADLDGIVLSGNDQLDGRVISIMATAGPAGGVGHDTTMVASSADHALAYGYLRLRAGQGKNVLVVGWAKPSESADPDRAEVMEAEPYLLRPTGMNNTIAAALQASTWLTDENVPDPSQQFVAWPLRREDLPARGDTVHAIVLAVDGEFPAGSELAWVVDAGWASTSYEIGTRNLGDLSSLHSAAEQIFNRNPQATPDHWDAVEIAGNSEYAVRAVQHSFPLRESTGVNLSGSLSERPTSPYVAGLSRMVAAIEAVRPSSLPADGLRLTAGIGFNGFAGQGATVIVFSNSKGGKE